MFGVIPGFVFSPRGTILRLPDVTYSDEREIGFP